MKKKTIIAAILLLLIIYVPNMLHSQEWGGSNPRSFWDHWSINVNAGISSYYGDLSYYDSDFAGKISNESGAAFGGSLTKYFNDKFGVSGQLIYGNFSGGKSSNQTDFKTRFFEYNIQAKIDFIRLFISDRNPKFGIEGFAGVGQLWFNVANYKYNEGISNQEKYISTAPEFVYFGGLGAHYHFSEQFAITADMSIKQLQNDRLDNLIKNNDFDFYTYGSIGVTYYIKGWNSSPMKNKARVAHSGIRSF
jgi:hypothetical protein